CIAVLVFLPWITAQFFRLYGGRPSELEAKYLLFLLFALGGLAGWADSEAVLPAYLVGMILAGSVGKDHILIRRLRTLCFGFLTPFYFIRAGSFVSVPDLIAAPAAFIVMLVIKLVTKIIGVYPVTRSFGSPHKEGVYTTLLMSTGLTFGTISSLFGLSHGIISQAQYSALVAAVIGSAVIPTLIPNAFYLPRHLLPRSEVEEPHASPRQATVPASHHAEGRRSSAIYRFGGRPKAQNRKGVRTCSKRQHANDGSEPAFHALELALAIAKQNASDLHMVSVEEIDYMPEYIEEIREETGPAVRRFHKVVQRARTMADERHVKLHKHIMAGRPVRDIVELAEDIKADLLVIGATGHSALYERLIGSRADRIVQLAPCPVLVVK